MAAMDRNRQVGWLGVVHETLGMDDGKDQIQRIVEGTTKHISDGLGYRQARLSSFP
jgi:hypothetical protein